MVLGDVGVAISLSLHIPQDVAAWAVFVFGALLVAYRIHGIDAPRSWIEWVERRFTYAMNLRFFGGFLLLAVIAALYLGRPTGAILSFMFIAGMSVLALVGLCLLLLQNHLRSLILATAEGSDRGIRLMSILLTLLGLGCMLAPFFV